GSRTPIGSALNSAEWADVPVALRERAFFSSRVESVRFLQRGRDAITDFLSGNKETLPNGEVALATGGRQQFVRDLSRFAIANGLGPLDPKDAGTIKDIRIEKRLSLIFDMQTRQAQDYGYWKQGMDADVLDEFPAQRFIREIAVKEPRDWHAQFEEGVWLKTDIDAWTRINRDFGVPWGPWGWGCGHGTEDVDRSEAEELGLIERGQAIEPVKADFNGNLKAGTVRLDSDLLGELRDALGPDQVEIDEEESVIRWKQSKAT
ncbi:MAG: hypothetical protein L0Z53_17530, partial [Acidobacteriales bacterium]|nr:hypothetical protein [Terriglobales bacterium]